MTGLVLTAVIKSLAAILQCVDLIRNISVSSSYTYASGIAKASACSTRVPVGSGYV